METHKIDRDLVETDLDHPFEDVYLSDEDLSNLHLAKPHHVAGSDDDEPCDLPTFYD